MLGAAAVHGACSMPVALCIMLGGVAVHGAQCTAVALCVMLGAAAVAVWHANGASRSPTKGIISMKICICHRLASHAFRQACNAAHICASLLQLGRCTHARALNVRTDILMHSSGAKI